MNNHCTNTTVIIYKQFTGVVGGVKIVHLTAGEMIKTIKEQSKSAI